MKIALIAPTAIPAQTANSVQVMKMAQALTGLGHKVRVFAPGRDPNLGWKKIAKQYGLSEKFKMRWVTSLQSLRRYDYALGALRQARQWGAEVIYTRLPQAAAISAGRGTPTIFELHDLPSGTMGPWLMRRFLAGKGAGRIVVNTGNLEKEIKSAYSLPKKRGFLLLAANGVDLDRFSQLASPQKARQKLGLPQNFTAGYTGHLYAGRGIEMILEMAQLLPQMRFLLVGGRDADVERLRTETKHLPNVTFAGFVPNADLPIYQAAADVLLMPYGSKVAASSGGDIAAFTNPLKMFEYLACGRPILASDLPILTEILNYKNAIILPKNHVDAWVLSLQELQRTPERRKALSKAGRETAMQFSWEKRAEKILRGL
jgi:glycosyltransferase involved in cell wall biosynthesis